VFVTVSQHSILHGQAVDRVIYAGCARFDRSRVR
jgi:hypothetical protein